MNHKGHIVFYGWWIVCTASVALFWGIPVTVYSFGVFFKPLAHEFHVSRSAVSLAHTLRAIADALTIPFSGWLISRFGTRRVVLPAAAIFALILISFRAFPGGIGQFYASYVALSLAGTGLGPLAWGNLVSQWFDRRRGLALGLAMVGIGCGAMLIPAAAQRLIASFGWRNTYAIFGCAVLLIPIPVVGAFLKEKPQDLGLLPDGDAPANRAAQEDITAVGLSASEAFRTGAFWLMMCAFFLVGASVQGCVVHAAALLSDRGLNQQSAAMGTAVLGAAVMIGRTGTGYLLDRFFAPRIAAFFFVCAAADWPVSDGRHDIRGFCWCVPHWTRPRRRN